MKSSAKGNRRTRCDLVIAEDEENIALVLGQVIRDAIPEIRIEFAKDGLEALSKIETLRPCIVWTCIRMPRLNGLDLIKAIRKDPKLKKKRIVVCTGYAGEEMNNLAIESGADVFMSKGDICTENRFEIHVLSAIARCLLWLAVPSSYQSFKRNATRSRKADKRDGG